MALFATLNIIIFAALIWWSARSLNQTDTRRKHAEDQAQRNLERIRALHEMDLAITSTLELPRTLDIFLDKLVSLLAYPTVPTISLWNREAGKLEPEACRNIDKEEWIAHYAEREHGVGYTKLSLESKTYAMSRNLQADPNTRHPGFVRRHGLVSYLVIPLFAKEEPVGTLGIFTKEEHEFAQEELEFLTTLAGQAAVAIHNSQLYQELVKSNRVKEEFLSVMSHELRTPLNVVMGYAAMVRDGLLGEINPKQEEALSKILGRANDQLAVINNILHATVLETQKITVEMQPVVLGDFINQLKASYEARLDKPLELKWDCSSPSVVLHTDGPKLKQILQNLIDNAIKFAEKGSVRVSTRVLEPSAISHQPTQNSKPETQNSQPWVEFTVADTGIGIPRDHLPFVFERFQQVDSSETRTYGGVGLGLYIARKFTEMLGGKVEAESEEGKGSTFTVKIPCEC